jgi:hypothetical protein
MRRLLAVLLLLAPLAALAEKPQPPFKPGQTSGKETLMQKQNRHFHELLKESGMRYYHPVGFEELKPEPSVFSYEKRLLHRIQDVEVRYSIRPVNRLEVDYEDPHNAAPHPNDMFDMLFRSVLDELSLQGNSKSNLYQPEEARKKFNAGWAAAAVFDLSEAVNSKYREGLLVAMHRDDRADAYILILMHDIRKHKPLIEQLLMTLAFLDDEPLVGSPTDIVEKTEGEKKESAGQ